MALSYVTYTANGSTQQFDITFSYIDRTHIKVYVNNVEDTTFTFINDTRIQTTSMPSNGQIVKIDRDTPTNARLVDFQDGSVLTESDLDKSANQNFFIAQETVDEVDDKLGLDNSNLWDADNKRIINVANPTANQDAVTRYYLENTWLSTSDKANINTLAAISSDVSTVAGISSNVTTVAGNNTNINTVAGISGNVTTVAGISSNVTSVANDATDIGTVATDISNVNTVAGSISNVNTVATNISNINTVANDLNEAISEIETAANDLNEATSEIDTVATNITNVNTVGTNIANVNTVAGNNTNINTVAGNNTNINTVAGISSNVTTVAGISSNVTTVAGDSADIQSVAGNATNINSVASNSSNINSVASNASNINTVAGDITNVNTTATNISDVNTFANRYRIGSADPTTSLDAGDLFFNTTSNELKHYNGSAWVVIQSDTDVKTKVSSNDTTAGFLNGKLVAGSNVTFTENSDGGNETLTIAATDNSIPFAIALG